MKKEIITASAVKFDGMIVVGKRHSNCIDSISQNIPAHVTVPQADQGFYTSHFRRVDRHEAMNIAIASGQYESTIDYDPNKYESTSGLLFSEDLW